MRRAWLLAAAAMACASALAGDVRVVSLPNGPCGVDSITNVTTHCPAASVCQPRPPGPSKGGGAPLSTCVHKPLFPLEASDAVAALLVLACCALAAGGGVGGGGLLVPVYLVVLNFESHQATSLSLATISGGALANLWTYAQRYHPNPFLKRPLIDFDASLLFGPPLLAGTMVGAVLSAVFPEWLVVGLLVLLLGQSARKTLVKGLAKWRQGDPDWGSTKGGLHNKDAAGPLTANDQAAGGQSDDDDDDDAAGIGGSGDGDGSNGHAAHVSSRTEVSPPWMRRTHPDATPGLSPPMGCPVETITIDQDGQPTLESSALTHSALPGLDDDGAPRCIDPCHDDGPSYITDPHRGGFSVNLRDLDDRALELAPLGRVAANGKKSKGRTACARHALYRARAPCTHATLQSQLRSLSGTIHKTSFILLFELDYCSHLVYWWAGGGFSSGSGLTCGTEAKLPAGAPATALGRSVAARLSSAAERRARSGAGQYSLMHDQTVELH